MKTFVPHSQRRRRSKRRLPAVRQHYNRISEDMESLKWYNDEQVLRAICQAIPLKAERVLELCCGSGRLLRYLHANRCWKRMVGVDLSDEMIRRARQHCQPADVELYQGDWLAHLDNREKQKTDVVIVKNALHLLGGLRGKLQDLSRYVTPDASLVVIETISPNKGASRFVRGLFSIIDPTAKKRHFFTRESLLRTLREGGWYVNRATQPVEIAQMLDVGAWLEMRCQNNSQRIQASRFLASASDSVRADMRYWPAERGEVPREMLRLQLVVKTFQSVRRKTTGGAQTLLDFARVGGVGAGKHPNSTLFKDLCDDPILANKNGL